VLNFFETYNLTANQQSDNQQLNHVRFYEYGFRDYDAQLGRWHVRDAMAESYFSTSPYVYALNNPIMNIDVDGLYVEPERNDRTDGVQLGFDLSGMGMLLGHGGGGGEPSFYGTHTYMEGTLGSMWVDNSDIIHVYDDENGWNLNGLREASRLGIIFGSNGNSKDETSPNSSKPSFKKRLQNQGKIFAGLFKGNLWQVVSRFTWEIFQTTLGFTVASILNAFGTLDDVYFSNSIAALDDNTGYGNAMISNFLIGAGGLNLTHNGMTFQHEYGHNIQSRILGPLYLPFIALPSILSASNLGKHDHDFYWTEISANNLANRYFSKRFNDLIWDTRNSTDWSKRQYFKWFK
jgi:RHS repeat-associated protein